MCRFEKDGTCTCKVDSHGRDIKCKKCTLYQTESDQIKSLAKAKARFETLSKEKQFWIIQTYYGGINPYND